MKKNTKIMFGILMGLLLFIFWGNKSIVTTKVDYKSEKIKEDFNGYKIAHISDFHNKKFGKDQEGILSKIRNQDPDIILITGDLVDSRRTDIEVAMTFVRGATEIGPVYYVSGNHEIRGGIYDELKELLLVAGVHVLDDAREDIWIGDSKIEILGLMDPFYTGEDSLARELKSLVSEEDTFKILLSHRPELVEIYENSGVDLIFAGHAHGGQIRLPFIGGIVAPGQGFFPKYIDGVHSLGDATLVISRGLGSSFIPIRTFNRPEIIILTLGRNS